MRRPKGVAWTYTPIQYPFVVQAMEIFGRVSLRPAALRHGTCQNGVWSGQVRQHQPMEYRKASRCRPYKAERAMVSIRASVTAEKPVVGSAQTDTRAAPSTRVLVLGGSIAGMLAAAAVSPYVDEVVILDKEPALKGAESKEQLCQVPICSP